MLKKSDSHDFEFPKQQNRVTHVVLSGENSNVWWPVKCHMLGHFLTWPPEAGFEILSQNKPKTQKEIFASSFVRNLFWRAGNSETEHLTPYFLGLDCLFLSIFVLYVESWKFIKLWKKILIWLVFFCEIVKATNIFYHFICYNI